MKCIVYGDERVCPTCKDYLRIDVDIKDGWMYDICFGCGFRRKRHKDGREEILKPRRANSS